MADIQVNPRQPTAPLKKWRILLVQRFTPRMHLLMATSIFGLGRRCCILLNSAIYTVSVPGCSTSCSTLNLTQLGDKSFLASDCNVTDNKIQWTIAKWQTARVIICLTCLTNDSEADRRRQPMTRRLLYTE